VSSDNAVKTMGAKILSPFIGLGRKDEFESYRGLRWEGMCKPGQSDKILHWD